MKNFGVFGAALDALDDEESISLKRAYVEAKKKRLISGEDRQDPYEIFQHELKKFSFSLIFKGKLPIKSYLRPKPNVSDKNKIGRENYTQFLDEDGCAKYSLQIKEYVENKIFPNYPLMIGIDHSLTGGVVRALSQYYGRENITLIIFDAHFDAIPFYLRRRFLSFNHSPETSKEKMDFYNCGNFIYYLLEDKVILPQNLILVGVSDYPDNKQKENFFTEFTKYYLDYEKRGVKFIPRKLIFNKNFQSHIVSILNRINTPFIYISIDLDVFTNLDVQAVRFPSLPPYLSSSSLLSLARLIRKKINQKFKLMGMDIMEINIHFLGIHQDKTFNRAFNFLKEFLEGKLLYCIGK